MVSFVPIPFYGDKPMNCERPWRSLWRCGGNMPEIWVGLSVLGENIVGYGMVM